MVAAFLIAEAVGQGGDAEELSLLLYLDLLRSDLLDAVAEGRHDAHHSPDSLTRWLGIPARSATGMRRAPAIAAATLKSGCCSPAS